ncbi:MAG: phosphoadenylyl-sulfate reductase [Bryobacteraceae bacterium]
MIGIRDISATELLRKVLDEFGRAFAIATSFQDEGMVLVDMAVRISPRARILTVDTGRLPAATLDMIGMVERHYGIAVETVQPDAGEVAAMISRFGQDLFRDDTAFRRLCCEVRKVRPLDAVQDVRAWAFGLRREQSESRRDIPQAEEVGGRLKLCPLAAWTKGEVAGYLREHGVPRHPLYAAGYATVGCDPCTRAVHPGEDERAGRWWWEQDTTRECGIHFSPDGHAERQVDVLLREVLAAR